MVDVNKTSSDVPPVHAKNLASPNVNLSTSPLRHHHVSKTQASCVYAARCHVCENALGRARSITGLEAQHLSFHLVPLVPNTVRLERNETSD